LARAPQYASCLATKSCQLRLAAHNEVDLVLALKVDAPPTGSGAWTLAAELHGPPIETPLATAQRACSSCTPEQGTQQLAALIEGALRQGAGRGHGSLQIASEPAGAEIRLGSLLLGKTPATLELWAGEYELSLSLPGGPSASVHATVAEGG